MPRTARASLVAISTLVVLILACACAPAAAQTVLPDDPDSVPLLPEGQPRHDGPTIVMTSGHTFESADVVVHVGATVTWVNSDTVAHTTSDDPSNATDPNAESLPLDAAPWNSGALEPGDSYSVLLDMTGEYEYVCRLHQSEGMIGHIAVVDDTYQPRPVTDSGG